MKTKKPMGLVGLLMGGVSVLGSSSPASAFEWEFLPESRHQQFLTYGLFLEEHSALVMRTANQLWLSIGGGVALIEVKDWAMTPQLTLWGTGNVGGRFNDKRDTMLTETDDARVGLQTEWIVDPQTRFSVGWYHSSGHISDNVMDPVLIGPNLGNEQFPIRIVHDVPGRFRFGGTLKPTPFAEPKVKILAADQFAEWFPFGVSDNPRKGTFYASVGFEEYGTGRIQLSSHSQLGMYWGNHLEPHKMSSIRTVVGYYNGMDPRLKYYQFRSYRSQFGYLGLMFDL